MARCRGPVLPMRFAMLTILFALVGATGLALATTPGGSREEASTPVPLVVYDAQGRAHTYFIKCANESRDLATCRGASIWEDVNPLTGLQTSPLPAPGGRWFAPDLRTLA